MKILSIVIVYLFLLQNIEAGEFDQKISSFPKVDTRIDTVIESDKLQVTNPGEAGNWIFDYPQDLGLIENVTVKLNNIPDGYLYSPLSFGIPYHKVKSETVVVGNVIVTQATKRSTRGFIKSTRELPNDPTSLLIYNQRARVTWQKLNEGFIAGREPNRDDVIVAFRLALSSRALVERYNFQVDKITLSALNVLSSLADNNRRNLLSTATAKVAQVRKLVEFLNNRDALVLERLVNNLENWVSISSDLDTRVLGCKKFNEADKWISTELDIAGRRSWDPDGKLGFRILILQLECTTNQLIWDINKAVRISDQYLVSAPILVERVILVIKKYKKSSQFPDLRKRAVKAKVSLENYISHLKLRINS